MMKLLIMKRWIKFQNYTFLEKLYYNLMALTIIFQSLVSFIALYLIFFAENILYLLPIVIIFVIISMFEVIISAIYIFYFLKKKRDEESNKD